MKRTTFIVSFLPIVALLPGFEAFADRAHEFEVHYTVTGIRARLELSAASARAGEPVGVQLRITNASNEPKGMPLLTFKSMARLEVRREARLLTPDTPGRFLPGAAARAVPLQPGETAVLGGGNGAPYADVSDLGYTLAQPGTYALRAVLFMAVDEHGKPLQTNDVVFTRLA